MDLFKTLADLYVRAARELGCKDLRLFLVSQSSRLRMMNGERPDTAAYVAATGDLLEAIQGMPGQRGRGARIVRLQ